VTAPIIYVPGFVSNPDEVFAALWEQLAWEKRADAPRRECWMNDYNAPYTYGNGDHARTYEAGPWHELITGIRARLLAEHGADLNCCFVNGYENERQHLGWHADASKEMSHDHAIAVVSFGAEREIWFREKGTKGHESIGKLLLERGSLLIMNPGMQLTHEHRIPKASAPCGPRLSLTYRGLLDLS